MKTNLKHTLTFCTLLVVAFKMQAQFNNGYGSGANGGRQGNTIPQAETPPEAPKALTAEEIVDQEIPNITEVLGLNPFEEAIVKTTLTKYVQKRIELEILKLNPEKTAEAMMNLSKAQDEELKSSLPEEKYNAFVQLKENRFKTKKKKKKKKIKE